MAEVRDTPGEGPPSIPIETDDHTPHVPGALRGFEVFWRDRYDWLFKQGYQLRRRYEPDWKPSWKSNGSGYFRAEDGIPSKWSHLMAATRVSDQAAVMLKRLSRERHPQELHVSEMFGRNALARDPRNHCVPLLEVLDDPDVSDMFFMVMPMARRFNDPPWDTIGEAAECFREVFEGLQFMHMHHVAHGDVCANNIMLDPHQMFPDSFHLVNHKRSRDGSGTARYLTRTQRPSQYWLIDFGFAEVFLPEQGPPRVQARLGADKTVPELQDGHEPCNPFPIDVYCAGNWIREQFLSASHGFEFMDDLVNDMVAKDPAQRPDMDTVVRRYQDILNSLSKSMLRSRVVSRNEAFTDFLFSALSHAKRRLVFTMMRTPALPMPNVADTRSVPADGAMTNH